MYIPSRTSRGGFTLIELMIAMVIFTVMSVMVMSVYLNTTYASRKLNATRQLTEVAREITERLAQDVREKGIDTNIEFDPSPGAYLFWTDQAQYTLSGSEYLKIQSGDMYVYGSRTTSGIKPCEDTATESTKSDNKIHCGLYIINGSEYYNLVDSFIPDEDRKRVKIQNLRFYISGGEATTKKVTLVMTLILMPRIGVPASLAHNNEFHIQTTISERGWKKN